MNDVILNKSACGEDVDFAEIVKLLPPWKTYILEAEIIDKDNSPKLSLKFLLDAHNEDEIQKWFTQLQDSNKITYSIYCTAKSMGKYVNFKQRLVCQHNTNSKNVYDPSVRSRTSTKNTNCPSKITVVLHAIKKRYRGKDKEKYKLLREMPCEVTFIATHNHATSSADSLRFRKMSDEVKEKLLNLFHNGHSAGTALESLKIDIQSSNDNYEEILVDRKYCPTYDDCYHLYRREFEKNYGPWEFNLAARKKLKESLRKFNKKTKDDCAKIIYQQSDYEVCVPPKQGFEHLYSRTSECSSNPCESNKVAGKDLTQEGHIAIENTIEIEIMDEEINTNNISSVETAKASAKAVLANINKIVTQFIERSPVEMAVGLNSMYETLKKIKNPSTVASCCINFGSGIHKKNRDNYIGLQSTAIIRQKTNLSGKRRHVGGHPRKKCKIEM